MPRTAVKDGPDPVDVHVGRKVQELRLQRGLNQSDLGRALGLTFQQVQKYEKGSNRISASKLHKIAETLGAPVQHFFPSAEEVELPARSEVEGVAVQRLRRFVSTFEGGRFVSTVAQSGPMLTIAVLHVPDQGHTGAELEPLSGDLKALSENSDAIERTLRRVGAHELQDSADHRRADRRASVQ